MDPCSLGSSPTCSKPGLTVGEVGETGGDSGLLAGGDLVEGSMSELLLIDRDLNMSRKRLDLRTCSGVMLALAR